MNGGDVTQTQMILDALRQTGQRGLLLTGWGGIVQTDLPDTVFLLNSVPHSWLFPKMAAIVHHGGAGTTAAALRAGIPSVVVPFFGDQPFWGDRNSCLYLFGCLMMPHGDASVVGLEERPINHPRNSCHSHYERHKHYSLLCTHNATNHQHARQRQCWPC